MNGIYEGISGIITRVIDNVDGVVGFRLDCPYCPVKITPREHEVLKSDRFEDNWRKMAVTERMRRRMR